MDAGDYIRMIEQAGFTNVSIKPVLFDKATVDAALDDMKDTVELKTISRADAYEAVYSAKITAYKPQ